MKTKTKVWLIIAAFLVLTGSILFTGIMTTLEWDFTKLSTNVYETSTHEVRDIFNGITINTDTADIVFRFSDDDKCRVECYEEEKAKHSVSVKDGILHINLIDNKSIYNFIGLNFDTPKITVFLPETEYATLLINESTGDIEIPKDFNFNNVDISLRTGDVDFNASAAVNIKIKTGTGSICAKSISADKLDLSVTTGKTDLSEVRCKNITSIGNTGDISLNNVIATEKLYIKRTTGDIDFESCDATDIYIETNTGDVNGSLLSGKLFITKTDTGSVNVPDSIAGDKCEIITNTGDITITAE